MGWVGKRPTHVPQNPHSPIPLKPQHGWWIEISRSRPCVHSNGQQQYICVNIACIWGIWDKLQYLFWRWCWQKYEEKIQRQKHLGPWGVVVGGDHLRREGNLGREFNCRKEIPDPDATILATDPVLAEVGGNSRGQLGQKRKLQEWEINDFRQWHL